MINKIAASIAEALTGIEDGATVLIGGFGTAGIPNELIDGLIAQGAKDLVIVNGDNADLSPILKPYHGLRIFTNDGKNAFSESYFYPMHGASALLTGDFDQDGRMGMAVSSYFPDKSGEKTLNFLLFQQTGNMEFQVSSIAELGKWSWLVMEKADIDGDDDLDIILGSFDFQTRFAFPARDWMPFVILENHIN